MGVELLSRGAWRQVRSTQGNSRVLHRPRCWTPKSVRSWGWQARYGRCPPTVTRGLAFAPSLTVPGGLSGQNGNMPTGKGASTNQPGRSSAEDAGWWNGERHGMVVRGARGLGRGTEEAPRGQPTATWLGREGGVHIRAGSSPWLPMCVAFLRFRGETTSCAL